MIVEMRKPDYFGISSFSKNRVLYSISKIKSTALITATLVQRDGVTNTKGFLVFTHPCEFSNVGTHTMGRIKIVIERLRTGASRSSINGGGGCNG